MSSQKFCENLYFNENASYAANSFELLPFEKDRGSPTRDMVARSSDCRFQSPGKKMTTSGAHQRRRESLGQIHCPKVSSSRQRLSRRQAGGPRPVYRHIPHRDKPPHLVARRNARERRRVQAVNNAFSRLRRHVPYENKQKRLSKVKTLRFAIDYIKKLKTMIEEYDNGVGQRRDRSRLESVSAAKKMVWSGGDRCCRVNSDGRFGQSDWNSYGKRLEHFPPM